MLEILKKLVEASDDESSECMLEDAGIDYVEVEDGVWIDDGKYQYRNYDVKIDGVFFSFSEQRSGSYYTDWYYTINDVCEYIPDTRYRVEYTFPDKEVALKFMSFIECTAEDLANELEIFEGDINYNYDFKTGSVELELTK